MPNPSPEGRQGHHRPLRLVAVTINFLLLNTYVEHFHLIHILHATSQRGRIAHSGTHGLLLVHNHQLSPTQRLQIALSLVSRRITFCLCLHIRSAYFCTCCTLFSSVLSLGRVGCVHRGRSYCFETSCHHQS